MRLVDMYPGGKARVRCGASGIIRAQWVGGEVWFYPTKEMWEVMPPDTLRAIADEKDRVLTHIARKS